MWKMTPFLVLFSVLFFQVLSADAQVTMGRFLADQELVKLGEKTYQRRCSGCHGEKGDAKGASPLLFPTPRDLTSGVFKFRSTPNGMLPLDDDLMRTLTQGVLGTSMPSFRLVPETQRLGLIAYIKKLSKAWDEQEEKPMQVHVPTPPEGLFSKKDVFLAAAEKGRQVYATSCALCHGYDGKGNGPASKTLQDEWGNPIPATDLTLPYIKSGYGARDVYRVLATGLNGTPMAAFTPMLGEQGTWEMVAYVMYLRGEAADVYPKGTLEPIPAPEPISEDDDESYFEE